MAAELGAESLSAYVISMANSPSDVLAVELLKREARLVVRTCPAFVQHRCVRGRFVGNPGLQA